MPTDPTPPPPGRPAAFEATGTDAARTADGVVVFGGVDWWYHNRGHYDLRMARRFARHVPVLYVNSIGMRVPRPGEGRMFARRITRKFASLRRGLVAVDPATGRTLAPAAAPAAGAPGLSVISLPWWPGRAGRRLAEPLAAATLRAAVRRRGIRSPLAWIACPTAWPLLDAVRPVACVYQRTDRYEDFPGVDRGAVRVLDRRLKQRADLTVFCSAALERAEGGRCRRSVLVDHGVDLARFDAAARERAAGGEPAELASIPRPRAGFVGAIDAHTFDPALFEAVVRRLPHVQFVLVGASTLPPGPLDHPNVHRLGRRDPAEVAPLMAGCDVLLMPWRRSGWIDACHPVKTREYLAAGRPVVTTPFADAARYGDLLRVAEGPAAFAAAIERALAAPPPADEVRDAVAGCDWNDRFAEVLGHLAAIEPARGGPVRLAGPSAPRGPADRASASDFDSPAASPVMSHDDAASRRPRADRTVEVTPTPRITPAARRPRRLAAVFVMAGGLEPSPIERLARRSVLDLPVAPPPAGSAAAGDDDAPPLRLVDRWIEAIGRIPHPAGDDASPLPVRVVAGAARPVPWPQATDPEGISRRFPHLRVRFERDPAAFRGMIGVLRDLGRGLDPDDHVLVVEAGRAPLADLGDLVRRHLEDAADVTCAVGPARAGRSAEASHSGTTAEPAGAWVLRARTLTLAPPAGWCDLKEQWLPRVIEAGGTVRAAELAPPGLPPVRDEAGLLDAIRQLQVAEERRAAATDPAGGAFPHAAPRAAGAELAPAEVAARPVRIIEPGAEVASSALVNDAVILAGAVVAGGAIVADQVVGPGGRSHRGRRRFGSAAA